MNSYPLSWPLTWPRTTRPTRSRFREATVAKAIDVIRNELRLLNARDIVISTNIALRNDGFPRSGQPQPVDRGAAVYFLLANVPTVLACDKWDLVEDNLWAIAKHIEAIRGQERWGVGTQEQAFAGYAALPSPPPADATLRDALQTMELSGDGLTADIVNVQYRKLAKVRHSDVGGSDEAMQRLNNARDILLRAVGQ